MDIHGAKLHRLLLRSSGIHTADGMEVPALARRYLHQRRLHLAGLRMRTERIVTQHARMMFVVSVEALQHMPGIHFRGMQALSITLRAEAALHEIRNTFQKQERKTRRRSNRPNSFGPRYRFYWRFKQGFDETMSSQVRGHRLL